MMKVYLSANKYTEKQAEDAKRVRESLEAQGFEFCENPSECQLVVSLGGDGAVLKAAKFAIAEGKPLIGINSGRLGYHCALKLQDIDSFKDVLKGAKRSERLILEVRVGNESFFAVNDMIFGKRYFGQTVEIESLSEGKSLLSVRGDGLIVSTPTGSTAYNANAKGPLVMSDVEAIVLTPVCADAKPLVISSKRDIEVVLKRGDCDMFVDGRKVETEEKSFSIKRADVTLHLLV